MTRTRRLDGRRTGARDLRTGNVGYRPAADADLKLAPGNPAQLWRGSDTLGRTGDLVADDDGQLVDPYAGEVTVGPCGGRCGRQNVRRRPVTDAGDPAHDVTPATVLLCDACILDDIAGAP